MDLKEKINFKKYFTISLLVTGSISLFFREDQNILIAIWVMYAGTVANHLLLVKGILLLTDSEKHKVSTAKKNMLVKVLTSLASKFGVMVLAIFISVQFVQSAIIIPITNYLIQIAVLGLCLKKAHE